MLTSRPLEGTPRLVQVWPCSWRRGGKHQHQTPGSGCGAGDTGSGADKLEGLPGAPQCQDCDGRGGRAVP